MSPQPPAIVEVSLFCHSHFVPSPLSLVEEKGQPFGLNSWARQPLAGPGHVISGLIASGKKGRSLFKIIMMGLLAKLVIKIWIKIYDLFSVKSFVAMVFTTGKLALHVPSAA